MGIFTKTLFQFFIEICIFLILTIIGDLIYKKIKVKWAKSELTNDLLPEDEVHTLRQVFYLILMALCFLNIFYNLTSNTIHIYYLVIFDNNITLCKLYNREKPHKYLIFSNLTEKNPQPEKNIFSDVKLLYFTYICRKKIFKQRNSPGKILIFL